MKRTIPGAVLIVLLMFYLFPCSKRSKDFVAEPVDTMVTNEIVNDTPVTRVIEPALAGTTIDPDAIVAFSKTLLGVPYLYASTDPSKGFDCSGFITYVFNHFGLKVPRSSVDFTEYGKTITIPEARPGDLILFTGTDSTVRIVGHMGIVESQRNDSLYFIHSSSGKKTNGVVITVFANYYRSRFVKVIRVFPDELFE